MSDGIVFEHAVRRIRRMRQEGESEDNVQALLGRYEQSLGLDQKKVEQASRKPGPINGYPFTMADQDNKTSSFS